MIKLKTQIRDMLNGNLITKPIKIEPKHTGLVIIDMWNFHWCKTATERVSALVPRMEHCLLASRKLGMQIFYCPTDVVEAYVGTPQREEVLAIPIYTRPELKKIVLPSPPPQGGGCACGKIKCKGNFGWDAMHPGLSIHKGDLMPNSFESLYSVCKKKNISHLIFMGVHTQACLLGRSVGLLNMLRAGFNCILARDLTDAHPDYDPDCSLTPDDLTARTIMYFERYLCPSIKLFDELRSLGYIKNNLIIDKISCAPWGTLSRPHLFDEPITVTLNLPWHSKATIYYTTDGSPPSIKSKKYFGSFQLNNTTELRAQAFENNKSLCIETKSYFVKLNHKPPLPDIHLGELKPLRMVGPGHSDSDSSHRWSPFVKPPQINRNNRGNQLILRETVYKHGIGVHAPNQMIFKINSKYDRFVAQVGVDEEILRHGNGSNLAKYPSVVFRIFIDGKMMTESPIMRISFVPWRFDVKIPEGTRIISLCTIDAGDGNKGDFANWVNAGFILKKHKKLKHL